MKQKRKKNIVCVGESLIDFIGLQSGVKISETKDYHRYLGGSPTNVAINLARLGLNVKMISTVGDDGFGSYAINRLVELGVDTSSIRRINKIPTSIIFVSRTSRTPEFIPFREADVHITESQIRTEILEEAGVFHTTCFALSKNPARETILKKAKEAYSLGCKLSIDINFSNKIWNDKEEAISVLKEYCSYNPLVKVSEDDVQRLFGNEISQEELFHFFHENNVDTVCLTLGVNGVILSQKGQHPKKYDAIKVDAVLDATGAGDAFWSGFLYAYTEEKSMDESIQMALKLAALKLQNVGRLPYNIDILLELSKIS